MKIGVIGTGVIASAMVTGFCDWECEHEFVLSPRNAEKSAALAAKYPNVTVAKDNQDVLDNCETVLPLTRKQSRNHQFERFLTGTLSVIRSVYLELNV